MDLKNSSILEAGYQKYQNEIALGKPGISQSVLENKYHVSTNDLLVYHLNW